MLAGIWGTVPLAKPITASRPPHLSARSAVAKTSPPTGSNKAATPSGQIARSRARRSSLR